MSRARVTIEGQMPSAAHGEWRVDSYNNVLFYTANDEQMDQRTSECIVLSIKICDMVRVYVDVTTTQ
jgi:hypothetical protein